MGMTSQTFRRLIVAAAFLMCPMGASAQEATLTGTVTDATGGVLPGVVVTAVHEASGHSFQGITDDRGVYRLPVRTGLYAVSIELQGFSTVTRSGIELLVGQHVIVNLQMAPGDVAETITVTGDVPLVNFSQSRLAGNVDPRQTQELPIQGRNYLDLTLLAPGSRMNAVTDVPAAGTGNFQINFDGQQVTNRIAGSGFGNPGVSKDAIAEFELVANRFDATQGRSAGVQVNVISKSGTNTPAGTLAGFFRDDIFNAPDFIQDRVLPYSNRQISATFGGPIRKDRVHYFVNYEYEHEPQTFTYTTPYPVLNAEQYRPRREHKFGGRADLQLSPRTHLTARATRYDNNFFNPNGNNVSRGIETDRISNQVFASLTQVLNSRIVNEIKAGYFSYLFRNNPVQEGNLPGIPPLPGFDIVPGVMLTGLIVGQTGIIPAGPTENDWSIRNDLTFTFARGGSHTLKVGGEYIRKGVKSYSCRTCMGILDAQGGPIPTNLEQVFPDPMNANTWRLDLLPSSIVRSYSIGVGDMLAIAPSNQFGGWVQHDWTVHPRLTVNLGVRYDFADNLFGNEVAVPPFLEAGRADDTDNWAPRLGAAFTIDDKTVMRGGFGTYYGDLAAVTGWFTIFYAQTAQIQVLNDGRPDFATNPFNGPIPTREEALASGQRISYSSNLSHPNEELPYSYQATIGVQRQLGATTAVSADYAYIGGRQELYSENINLTYNPATGANYRFTDPARLPYPTFGPVVQLQNGGWSDYHGLTLVLTKRLSNRWQASGNYLMSVAKDGTRPPVDDFAVADDLYNPYTHAVGDQRHRAVFNGIWQVGRGLQLSGLYFFASGPRYSTNWGGDLRGVGAGGTGRLRPDGTIVPRNNLVGDPMHRVDLRLQQRFRFGASRSLDGLFEVFNLFNHRNYGSYATSESLSNYGQPTANENVAYTPRAIQLGFRLIF